MKKIIVITGGTSGIGKALKEKFEQDDNICYALSIENNANVSNFFECDVTNEERVKQVLKEIYEKHNQIDILINSAGYGLFGATEMLSTDSIKKQVDVNFMGTVITCKNAIKYMKQGGKIINISSACALFPLPYRNIYCASKSAVASFTEGLKMELKPLQIEVTHLCPGDIKTPFIQNRVKDFTTNERYADRIKKASEYVEAKNDNRMTTMYAVSKMYKIINKKKLKPMYIIGNKYKLLNFAMRFFPKSLYLKIVEKHFGGHK